MSDTDIAAIEARELRLMERLHVKGQIDGQDACTFCDHLWPRDAARLLAALRAAEAREARLMEAAQALSDFLYDGIGWIEYGPAGMSVADSERLDALGDALRTALASTEEPAPTEPEAAMEKTPVTVNSPRCGTCGHYRGEHHARRLWEARPEDQRLHCYHSSGGMIADCACAEFVALTEPEAEREMAWLIERGQSMKQIPTVWYAEDEWTTDAREARRFATREDCEAFIDSRSGFAIPSHGDRFGVAVEHIFALVPTEPEAER